MTLLCLSVSKSGKQIIPIAGIFPSPHFFPHSISIATSEEQFGYLFPPKHCFEADKAWLEFSEFQVPCTFPLGAATQSFVLDQIEGILGFHI